MSYHTVEMPRNLQDNTSRNSSTRRTTILPKKAKRDVQSSRHPEKPKNTPVDQPLRATIILPEHSKEAIQTSMHRRYGVYLHQITLLKEIPRLKILQKQSSRIFFINSVGRPKRQNQINFELRRERLSFIIIKFNSKPLLQKVYKIPKITLLCKTQGVV